MTKKVQKSLDFVLDYGFSRWSSDLITNGFSRWSSDLFTNSISRWSFNKIRECLFNILREVASAVPG